MDTTAAWRLVKNTTAVDLAGTCHGRDEPAGMFATFARENARSAAPLLYASIEYLRAIGKPPTTISLRLPLHPDERLALRHHGFRPTARELEFLGDLTGRRHRLRGLRRRNLFQHLDAALPLLEAATSHRPDYRRLDGTQSLARLLEIADEDPANSLWSIYFRADTPIAIALPSPGLVGAMMAFGVATTERGKGYGHRIHADALASLARAGVKTYIDHVDSRNIPMQRIMATNRCHAIGGFITFQDRGRCRPPA